MAAGREANGRLITDAGQHRVLQRFFAIPQTSPQELIAIRRCQCRPTRPPPLAMLSTPPTGRYGQIEGGASAIEDRR